MTLQAEFLGSLLTPDDLHGIWHGFVAMRGWRDGRVPQECLWAVSYGRYGGWPLISHDLGVSENSVPLNPMVNDHYPSLLNGYNWEYTLFSDKPIS